MIYAKRGIAYIMLEEYEPAIDDFSAALEINPEYANGYRLRGLIYKELGRTDEAKSDFAKYKELTGEDAQ
jgi:tetratricopeptide (TPR) repeat protein